MDSLFRKAKRAMWGHEEYAPPGHFYSPVTHAGERPMIARRLDERRTRLELPGIDLDTPGQFNLLRQLGNFYSDLPFTEEPDERNRYHYNQRPYSYADGIIYACMLRQFEPRRIIEVGSGYSSALALDIIERFLGSTTELTLIEPHPDRLETLLTPDDLRTRLMKTRVQDVAVDTFLKLEKSDILFIDSTHVSKPGSDVNFLVLEVLPLLKPGVLVHFHDIFYPFEYPANWILEGRSWNEAYLLHGFLKFNPAFRIRLFSTLLQQVYADWFMERMPLCVRNPGGNIWIQRCLAETS